MSNIITSTKPVIIRAVLAISTTAASFQVRLIARFRYDVAREQFGRIPALTAPPS
jgi:hypothetical protein